MASKNLSVSSLLDLYGGMLTDKQRSFLEYYYNDDLSLAEIAQNEGITRQGVYDIVKRATDQLKSYEEKLKLSERFEKIYDEAQAILDGHSADEKARSIQKICYLETEA